MVPSSFMISQITPEGLETTARREISTAASVWPARTSGAASRRPQRKKDMGPASQIIGPPWSVDRDRDGLRARSAAENAGVVTPSLRFDGDGEGGLHRFLACCGSSGCNPRVSTPRSLASARTASARVRGIAMKLTPCGRRHLRAG